jgi:hypothetical protein
MTQLREKTKNIQNRNLYLLNVGIKIIFAPISLQNQFDKL